MPITKTEAKVRPKDIVDALLLDDDYIERLGSVFAYHEYHEKYGIPFDSYLRQQASDTWVTP